MIYIKSIRKFLIFQYSLGIIISIIIGIFIYNKELFLTIYSNVYRIIPIIPFTIMYLILLIISVKGLLSILIRDRNRKLVYLKENSKIIEIKKFDVKKHYLIKDGDGRNVVCYQIVLNWLNPDNKRKYKFKSEYFWYNPKDYIKNNIKIYCNDNYKKYYVDVDEYLKKDLERKDNFDNEERKNVTFKFYYNFTKSYIDNDILVAYDIIRKKDIRVPINKIKKITKVINDNKINKLYLYTLGKQLELARKNNNHYDELVSSLLLKVSGNCVIED